MMSKNEPQCNLKVNTSFEKNSSIIFIIGLTESTKKIYYNTWKFMRNSVNSILEKCNKTMENHKIWVIIATLLLYLYPFVPCFRK